MKILIAPNALKGSLSARAAAEALAAGVRRAVADAELVILPVADGGDGLTAVLCDALRARPRPLTVSGPVGKPVEAAFLYSPEQRTAFIEMATAAGLALVDPDRLAPITSNTLGVGQLITAALDEGARRIVLGIGGSATSDGGMGMAQALGIAFLDQQGQPLQPCGGALMDIARIDTSGLDPRLGKVQVQVICDVDNPLLGERGAAAVFAPQKGASPEQVATLEAGLAHFADLIHTQLGVDVDELPGAGAAGGLGAGAVAFLGASLQPGAELVLDLLDFNQALKGADLVITAEGRLDAQTAFGKAPAAVGHRARAAGIPCIAIAGSLDASAEDLDGMGIDAAGSLCPGPISVADAMQDAAKYLEATATRMMNTYCAGHRAGVLQARQDPQVVQ